MCEGAGDGGLVDTNRIAENSGKFDIQVTMDISHSKRCLRKVARLEGVWRDREIRKVFFDAYLGANSRGVGARSKDDFR